MGEAPLNVFVDVSQRDGGPWRLGIVVVRNGRWPYVATIPLETRPKMHPEFAAVIQAKRIFGKDARIHTDCINARKVAVYHPRNTVYENKLAHRLARFRTTWPRQRAAIPSAEATTEKLE